MDSEKHQQFAQRLVRDQNKVFRYIVSLIPHRADAEELFQQTCLTLWENWERYDLELDFIPWACGIAHNHVRNFLRKKGNHQRAFEEDVLEQLQVRSLQRQQANDPRREALLSCMNRLPDSQRSILESYYAEQLNIEQIAEVQASTTNAIYKMLRRLRSTLQECIIQQLSTEATS